MTFYNVCPAGIESGGPELAHQMCHRLDELGCDAKMYYITSNVIEPQDVPASGKYLKYNTQHAVSLSEIENPQSVVIFNEGATGLIPLVKGCRTVLWWMSVDNYLINTDGRDIDVIRQEIELHIVQSKYAYEYVRNVVKADEGHIMYVSDYIGDIYMTEVPEIPRHNIALYNPKKGLDKIKPLIERISWLKWVPLIGLTEEDMVAYMHIAKIYIDFGNHPGKDRIPREAATCGCCIITNRKGSAAFYEDVSIPDKYKFGSETDYDDIEQSMRYICDNFYEANKDFDEYRMRIRQEKAKFNADVENFSNFFKLGG
ncbi:MAG: hypothetical protein ACI4D1_06920 [Lachnospira sp.]